MSRPLVTARDPWRRFMGRQSGARGSLLAALLVMMTLASIMLAVASTQWSFIVRREREKELIFRGTQIVRGIDAFRAKNSRLPTTLEEMTKLPNPVLRQEWADPMTARYDDDGKLVEGTGQWQYIAQGDATGSGPPGGHTGPPGTPGPASGSATGPATTSSSGASQGRRGGLGSTPQIVPFEGVASTSDEEAIGSYADLGSGRKYSEWRFRVFASTGLQGRLDLPRPPGFGGYRSPGGPPISDTIQVRSDRRGR